jgi:hypothetical protein
MKPDDAPLPAPLAAARRQFEHWRSTRSEPGRIPPPLWRLALRCARKYGLYRTVRALRLDYTGLKKRLLATGGTPATAQRSPAPGFVELVAPGLSGPAECVIEVARPGGTKLRIELRGSRVPDVAELARRFSAEEA